MRPQIAWRLFLASPVVRSINFGGSFPAGDRTTRARSFRSTVEWVSTGSAEGECVSVPRLGGGASRSLARLAACTGVSGERGPRDLVVASCRCAAVEEPGGCEADLEPERATDPIDSVGAVARGSANVRRSPRSPGSVRASKPPSPIKLIRQRVNSRNLLRRPRKKRRLRRSGGGISRGRVACGSAF